MATIYRAYGRDDRGAHRLYTHWLTAGADRARRRRARLVPAGAVALHRLRDVEPVALHRPELRRADDVPAPRRRRRVGRGAAAPAPRLRRLVRHAAGGVQRPARPPIRWCCRSGLPPTSARIVEAGAGLDVPRRRRWPRSCRSRGGRRRRRAARAADALLDAGALVRAAGGGELDWRRIDAPQTRYSSGMLAVMHSAQYLWITRYFARRDAEQAARAGGWSPWRYWATLVAGGVALFLPIPWLASYGWHVDFTASVLHRRGDRQPAPLHDRRRGVEAAQPARRPRAGAGGCERHRRRTGAVGRRPPMPRRDGARRSRGPGAAALVAALARLAAVDQWRYVLAIGHGERDRLAEAARLNPYDSGTYLRLAQVESEAGDPAAAAAALRRAVDGQPAQPDAGPRRWCGGWSRPARSPTRPAPTTRCWPAGPTTSTRS